jgi:hypothetical protein
MTESIPQAHERLNYSQYEPRLRAVRGVWAQLQQLKSQPATYIAALERHIATLRKREEAEAPLGEAELAAGVKELHVLWSTAYERIWPLTQSRLPCDVLDWMRKWLPADAAKFESAYLAWQKQPSANTLAGMRRAIPAFFTAYETAV